MDAFQLKDSPYPIREDLKQAYREYWVTLAAPGTWWTGAQRIAIASETREAVSCDYCAERKQALSPYNFSGQHQQHPDSSSVLPAAAIDAVHRVITDQSRISKSYVQENAEQELSELAFVELVGVAVAVFSIDESIRALGLEPEPLPAATTGEPSRYTPPGLLNDTGIVPMLGAVQEGEHEQDLWPCGQTANVLRALSGVPNAVREWMGIAKAQYLTMEQMLGMLVDTHRSLNRMQMELIAGRVSSHNECFY